ncbi:glycerol-3-phosphate 1-O-acyltransferase PlsY [Heliobacterium mobile]|nr:glycerol-3-phosphate 1-O-acyltransferase PlsY [Heliobacterium mobile]
MTTAMSLTMDWSSLGLILLSFFLGSIPFAYLAGKAKGIDIRKHGSGNIGATNAFRVLGATMGAAVLLLDAGKAALATWLGQPYGGTMAVLAGLAAILGHTFSPFMKFKGGKGVASAAGVVLTIAPLIALICLAAFALAVYLTSYVSVGSILAAVLLPVLMYFLGKPVAYQVFALAVSLFVIYRHRSNIKRLMEGTENPIRRKTT